MGSAKNRLARLARAGDGPWSGDLAMSEGLRCAEHGTFISLLEMSCAAFARAMIDLNLSCVKMCNGGGQSATTVDLPRGGAFRRHAGQKLTCIWRPLRACMSACVLVHACSRARSNTCRNGTVENSFSMVLFPRVDIRRRYACY